MWTLTLGKKICSTMMIMRRRSQLSLLLRRFSVRAKATVAARPRPQPRNKALCCSPRRMWQKSQKLNLPPRLPPKSDPESDTSNSSLFAALELGRSFSPSLSESIAIVLEGGLAFGFSATFFLGCSTLPCFLAGGGAGLPPSLSLSLKTFLAAGLAGFSASLSSLSNISSSPESESTLVEDESSSKLYVFLAAVALPPTLSLGATGESMASLPLASSLSSLHGFLPFFFLRVGLACLNASLVCFSFGALPGVPSFFVS